MIRFAKSHIGVLSIVAIIAAAFSFAYLPMWRAWPDVVPSSLRGLFVAASMPWSWATLTAMDAALWRQPLEINRIVSELVIAVAFGINVAAVTAGAWFVAKRRSGIEIAVGNDA